MIQLQRQQVPAVVCLHFLGGSARTWGPIAEKLEGRATCRPLDLPGFGGAADLSGFDVESMADHVMERIGAMGLGRWILTGHSMGGKVALVLARRAEDGAPALRGLVGLLLLASSPPCPEPIEDDKRAALTAWIDAAPAVRDREARAYIRSNVGAALDRASEDAAVADVLRASPEAWKAWLQAGSREDWSGPVGRVCWPAFLVSGSADQALGPAVQERMTLPHLAAARHVVLDGAGHLLPLERPGEVARLMLTLAGETGGPDGPSASDIPSDYRALVASDRVNSRLRTALRERAAPDDPAYRPRALDEVGLALLRAVVECILPNGPVRSIDIAARIDARLASGKGDGWRHVALPPDAEAYRGALLSLEARAVRGSGAPFLALDASGRDAVLAGIATGGDEGATDRLDGSAMRLWFEDLRAETVRIYLAHPAALARIGFGGIGAGGDDPTVAAGYRGVGLGERESWEPFAAANPHS